MQWMSKMAIFNHWLEEIGQNRKKNDRPSITLSFAQSLDACLTVKPGQPTPLSGLEALRSTHQVRAAHEAILIGVGTVLADNPHLDVRFVHGKSPIPVILDSCLRIPLDSNLLQRNENFPWIFCKQPADPNRKMNLERMGARVFECGEDDKGFLNLAHVVSILFQEGINRLMVEGGGQVITQFLSKGRVDQVIITIAPVWLGGLPSIDMARLDVPSHLPRIKDARYIVRGKDVMVYGSVEESAW
jgi:3,4-dihydroxy 2-butanone 4-phosphate synthase/GTP cyclohydrolase II